MRALIFDIETGANEYAKNFVAPFDKNNPDHMKYGNLKDPEKREAAEKQAYAIYYSRAEKLYPLWAATGRVLSIGHNYSDTPEDEVYVNHISSDMDEKTMLEIFWDMVADIAGTGILVGFNSNNFDIPFLVKRSWINNVTPYPLKEGRWFKPFVVDLYDVWNINGKAEGYPYVSNSMASILNMLNLGNKDTTMGSKFQQVFVEDLDKAIGYAKDDVIYTRRLYDRLSNFIRLKNNERNIESI